MVVREVLLKNSAGNYNKLDKYNSTKDSLRNTQTQTNKRPTHHIKLLAGGQRRENQGGGNG